VLLTKNLNSVIFTNKPVNKNAQRLIKNLWAVR
jgi:hypothetical protein